MALKLADAIIILDASVLINFLKIDRVDLLGKFPAGFLITEHLRNEITVNYGDQLARLEQAVADGVIAELRIEEIDVP